MPAVVAVAAVTAVASAGRVSAVAAVVRGRGTAVRGRAAGARAAAHHRVLRGAMRLAAADIALVRETAAARPLAGASAPELDAVLAAVRLHGERALQRCRPAAGRGVEQRQWRRRCQTQRQLGGVLLPGRKTVQRRVGRSRSLLATPSMRTGGWPLSAAAAAGELSNRLPALRCTATCALGPSRPHQALDGLARV